MAMNMKYKRKGAKDEGYQLVAEGHPENFCTVNVGPGVRAPV